MGTAIAILSAILVFGAIIFFHELGHLVAAKVSGITVYEFAVGMGPALFKKEIKGTIYSLRILPFGGFTSMEGEDEYSDDPGSFAQKSPFKRFMVLVSGSICNLLMGYILLLVLTIMNGYVGTTYIAYFQPNSVSEGILQIGDQITKVNGHRVTTSNDIQYEFMRDQDGLIDLTVKRGDEILTLPIQFNLTEVEEGLNFISIDFVVAAFEAQPLDYLRYPVNWGMSVAKQVWGSLIDLLTGRYAVNQLSGPVGVVSAITEASKLGLKNLLLLAAFLAINVGIFNLLPFPVLDGGKVVLLLVETVIRRTINQKIIDIIMTGSVALLVLLMCYVTFNDIFKIFFN